MMPAGFSTPCRGLQAKALTKPYLRQKHTRGAVDVSKPSGTTKCASSLISPSSTRVQSRRRTITLVIPSLQGDASSQSPPDLPSYIFKERIVYLGMTLVPSVTELILAELLYLQYEDSTKPIQLYINSTGTSKDGQKYGYDTEAFAIYDTIQYIKSPVHTVAVGTAWGEAAMLLASGAQGYRSALPAASIMLKQPISSYRGQASELEIHRQEMRNTKSQMIEILSKALQKTEAEIAKDINRPRYFDAQAAKDYGIIDKVLDG